MLNLFYWLHTMDLLLFADFVDGVGYDALDGEVVVGDNLYLRKSGGVREAVHKVDTLACMVGSGRWETCVDGLGELESEGALRCFGEVGHGRGESFYLIGALMYYF